MASQTHHADGGIDLAALRDALAGPGMDTRQWVSFGVVEAMSADTPEQAVEFTPEFGPLVCVVLQPSGYLARCRVSGMVAGNMEAEYHPFITGDEVIVVIPEGDERAGCTIIGRLNNEIDQWPGGIAGQNAADNTFAFRRIRTPYILEFASSYLMRSAGTGAFLSMTQDGQVTLANADNAFLSLTPDFIGIQSGDASLLLQLDLHQHGIVLQVAPPLVPTTPPVIGSTTFTIAENSSLLSTGTFTFNCSGQVGTEHAASAEAVANMLFNVLSVMWAPWVAVINGAPPLAPLAQLVTPAAILAAMNGGIAAAGAGSIAPFAAAIAAALAAKPPGDITGTLPSVGSPGILIG